MVGSRDPRRAASAIAGWPATWRAKDAASYGDAIGGAHAIVLAVPFDTVDAILAENRARFGSGALVIDVTVPVSFEDGKATLAEVPEGSASEHVKAHVPPHVRVAAAFKTVPAHILDEIERPLDCDEFVCGDSPEARADAVTLVQAIRGLRAVDLGPLARARSIEHLTYLAIGINRKNKIRDARFRIVGL